MSTDAEARATQLGEEARAMVERAMDPGQMAYAQVLATLAVAAQLERIAVRLDRGLDVVTEGGR